MILYLEGMIIKEIDTYKLNSLEKGLLIFIMFHSVML